jgi:hypothetical protein
MRALAALLLLAIPLGAQERANRIGLFVANPVLDNSSGDNAGFGVAYERRFTERWTAEVSVSREESVDSGLFDSPDFEVRTTPVDLTVRFDFLTPSAKWRPFLGAGARWVDSAPVRVGSIRPTHPVTTTTTACPRRSSAASIGT